MGRSKVLAVLVVLAACSAGGTGPADGQAPLVQIVAPAAGATVGLLVAIDVNAVDDYGVDKIRILIDGALFTEIFTPPFRVIWNTSSLPDNSVHVIRVEALDVAKNVGSQQISVTILRGPQ